MSDNRLIAKLQDELQKAEELKRKYSEEIKLKDRLIQEQQLQLKHYSESNKIFKERIERIEQHFNSIIDSTLDAIITADSNSNIILWSRGANLLFGWTEKEVLGKPLTLLMPKRYHDSHHHGFNRYLSTRVPHVIGKIVELHGINKAGEEFPIDLSLGSWEINGQVFFCGIIRDTSSRKKVEEERNRSIMLELKNKELEQFAYVASHDLQEPLKTISSFIELFKEQYGNNVDDLGHKYLHYILQSSTRMKTLINELLDYSRIGRIARHEKVDFNRVVRNVAKDLRTLIREIKAEIEIGDLPTINANETEIRQLFQNLITNALKFRRKDILPKVKITAEKKKDKWEFCVEDNGIGIEKKYHDKIFIIFQRLHPKSAFEGTGLGLALCKKIVEFHDGEIWFDSQLGEGTKFCFTIKEK